uniref:Zinc finger protein 180 n=1 Tax=Ceratitis capitata TaxID=7213 RepID=W8BVA0_CERCA
METESVMIACGTDIADIDTPVPDPVSVAKSSNIQKSVEADDDTNMCEDINIQECKNFNPKFSNDDLLRRFPKNSKRRNDTEFKTQLHILTTDKRDVRCSSKIQRECAVAKINRETVESNQKGLALDHSEKKTKRRNKGTKNNFKCEQCSHSFAHKITLDAHIRKVHEGIKRPFQCDRCDKSYSFFGGLYTHIKEIHDAEVRSYACNIPGCDRIYTSFIAMEKHKRLKHTDTPCLKKYICEHCGATFNQSGNLKYHRRTKHPTEAEQAEKNHLKERFECDICKKHFHSRYTLKYHTLQLHSNEMKYECNICGRRMAKKFMLVQHMLVHSTDKMPCNHCGRQFIRKFELEAHIKAVHMKLKPFECQYCLECFASRKTLRHHEYIHTGEKPYVCDVCGQAYRQQTCLKNHRKSHENLHSDEKPPPDVGQALYNAILAPPMQCPNKSIGNIDKS